MGSPLYTNSIWKILAKLDFRQLFIELYQAMSDKIEHLPFELSPSKIFNEEQLSIFEVL